MKKWKTVSGNAEVKNNVLKVLGLTWRTEQDDFIFDLESLMDFLEKKKKRKRGSVISCRMHLQSNQIPFSLYNQSEMPFPTNVGTWT